MAAVVVCLWPRLEARALAKSIQSDMGRGKRSELELKQT